MIDHSQHEVEQLQKETVEEDCQYLIFAVSGERYAIDISVIREIVEVGLMTDVPLAPSFIHGVVDLRGGVLPVVDMSTRLKRKKQEITARSCIVVADVSSESGQAVGMLVDEVNAILDIEPGLVQPPPALGDGVQSDFLKGMAHVGDRFIVLLEVDRILSPAERNSLEHITQQQTSGP